MRSLERAPLWVMFNMPDVLVRGGDQDTDTQEGRPSQDSGRRWPSANPGVSHHRTPARPRSASWTPAPQNGDISVCCLSFAVCGTSWWQPWKTNVVTIISQIIPQSEMFLKCFKMFSDLNMDEYILFLLEKIWYETASIHYHFWCSYRTPDRWVEKQKPQSRFIYVLFLWQHIYCKIFKINQKWDSWW